MLFSQDRSKSILAFAQPILLKFFFGNENIKILSKIMNLKKKKIKGLQFLYTVYNVYVMFYYKIPWFYQDFKSENLRFLNLHSVHAAKIRDATLEVMLSPPK